MMVSCAAIGRVVVLSKKENREVKDTKPATLLEQLGLCSKRN